MSIELADQHTTDDEIALLQALVSHCSITPDDAGCQGLIAERLKAAGFTCESMPFGDVDNLWARRGSAEPLLCLAGHTDVVPPGDLAAWHTDPFVPTVVDGHMFGRGTADMKAGLAAMVVAAEEFVAENPEHRGSIAFLITSDEEGRARDGTLKVIETLQARSEAIDWCVLGEPSSESRIGDIVRVGRRGSLSGLLIVRGTQGHVAYPQLADNPIARFAPVLAELVDIEWDNGNEFFPPTIFQVVDLQSGVGAPNVTPPDLRARFNFRYSTEWEHTGLQKKVAEILNAHQLDYELSWHLSGKPFITKPGVLTEAISRAVHEVTGAEPQLSTGGGTSDGRFISPAGADVVELGPINASIHKVNECVKIDDVRTLRDIYSRVLKIMLAD